ncbi:hypothetical protein Lser_V15G33250 [Lactuca serriola]
MRKWVDRNRSTMRGNCRVTKNEIGIKANPHIGASIHGFLSQKTRNNVALKATIIAVVEINKAQIPISNRLGRLTRKSISAKRAVRMDKNTSNAVLDANSEIASDIAKIEKAMSFLNKGAPVVSLVPPGTVIAAANTIVVISAAVMLHDSAVVFIHFSPSFTKFPCSLVNNISGVSLKMFSRVMYVGNTSFFTS